MNATGIRVLLVAGSLYRIRWRRRFDEYILRIVSTMEMMSSSCSWSLFPGIGISPLVIVEQIKLVIENEHKRTQQKVNNKNHHESTHHNDTLLEYQCARYDSCRVALWQLCRLVIFLFFWPTPFVHESPSVRHPLN